GNAAIMLVGMAAAMVATGGLESPGAPGGIIITVLASVLASARAARHVCIAAIAIVAAFAIFQAFNWMPDPMPVIFGGASHRPPMPLAIARGIALALMVVGAYVITTRVRAAFERMAERASTAARALVEGLHDENRTLALLTAEIAHELKNPLASVKGL